MSKVDAEAFVANQRMAPEEASHEEALLFAQTNVRLDELDPDSIDP